MPLRVIKRPTFFFFHTQRAAQIYTSAGETFLCLSASAVSDECQFIQLISALHLETTAVAVLN